MPRSPAPAPPPLPPDPSVAALFDWLDSHHRGAVRCLPQGSVLTGRAILAPPAGIPKGSPLVAVPLACLLTATPLSPPGAGGAPPRQPLDSVFARLREKGCPGRIALLLRLALERSKGPGGFWAPYLGALPSDFPGLPLSWPQEDAARLLGGTRLLPAVVAERRAAEEEPARWASALLEEVAGCDPSSPSGDVASERLLRLRGALSAPNLAWSRCVVWTRALSVAASPTGAGAADADRVVALVPGADMLDHDPLAKVGWVTSHCPISLDRPPAASAAVAGGGGISPGGTFALVADEAVEGGARMMNNYGAKGNAELLLG